MSRLSLSVVFALAVVPVTATCIPPPGPDETLVTSTRILAIRADPAEALPGTRVTFTSFVAGPDGTVSNADIDWNFCVAPEPLTESNVVSNACLGSGSLVAAGRGPNTTAMTPADGCSVYGPDVGSAGLRPRDPDSTGGYYQPVRADLPGEIESKLTVAETFALARIHCDLANADEAEASAFAAAYVVNQNPQLLPLAAVLDGSPMALTGVPRGARITLEASWPDTSAETFAYFDPTTQAVTSQRESMQVAWYATGGTFDAASTGRAPNDPGTTSTNVWTSPDAAGTVIVWIVLRDSRGGVDFASYPVNVTGP